VLNKATTLFPNRLFKQNWNLTWKVNRKYRFQILRPSQRLQRK